MADESQKWVLMVTAKGPMNMSVIKYWGKRNEELVLPVNDSISISFDTDDMCAHTTIAVSPTFDQDRLWLNGKEHSLDTIRFQSVLRELRGRATDFYDKKKGIKITKEDWQKLHLHIGSVNNFPTAAGLASSAAGFATLVFAGANLMNLKEDRCQLSAIARLGSGSACRGLFAGFQKWNMGTDDKGSDCFAYQLYDENYWPDLVTVIAVVSSRQKEVSSKKGMVESADSSLFLQYRAKEVVPKRRARMEEALKNRDFTTFAHITNVESNQFHAVCLDTYPPLFYMNDNSRRIINIIEYWNRAVGEPQACYTYDAGPNGVLFARNRKAAGELIRKLLYHFPPNPDTDVNSMFVGDESIIREVGVKSYEDVQKLAPPPESRDPTLQIRGGITHFICTKPGRGPQLITDESEFLLDPETGFPK